MMYSPTPLATTPVGQKCLQKSIYKTCVQLKLIVVFKWNQSSEVLLDISDQANEKTFLAP